MKLVRQPSKLLNGASRQWRRLVGVAIAVVGILALSHALWLKAIGQLLIVVDPLKPADAIMTLAGELQRVSYAATLYQAHYAPELILTDMTLRTGRATDYAGQARSKALSLGIPDAAISLIPGIATTTFEEAVNARAMVEEKGWTSLIVVTSPSHTRRAQIIFRHVFGDVDIGVSVQPIRDHWYRADSWWKSAEGRRETWLEYLKLALYFVGVR